MKTALNILGILTTLIGGLIFTLCVIETIHPNTIILGSPISNGEVSIQDWLFGIMCLILGIVFLKMNKEY